MNESYLMKILLEKKLMMVVNLFTLFLNELLLNKNILHYYLFIQMTGVGVGDGGGGKAGLGLGLVVVIVVKLGLGLGLDCLPTRK